MASRHAALVPLSREHHAALALAFRLHHPAPPGPVTPITPASTPAGRAREVQAFFAAQLVRHFAAEEDAVFPAVASHAPAGDPAHALVARLRAEHRELERLRDAIDPGAAEATLAPALGAFADLLERHVRAEERELFVRFEELVADPDVRRAVADAVTATLGPLPEGVVPRSGDAPSRPTR